MHTDEGYTDQNWEPTNNNSLIKVMVANCMKKHGICVDPYLMKRGFVRKSMCPIITCWQLALHLLNDLLLLLLKVFNKDDNIELNNRYSFTFSFFRF